MKRSALIVIAVVIVIAGAGRAFAHHSFTAAYESGKRVEIEGVVKEFVWRNPHSFVQLEGPEKQGGSSVRWAVEWAGGLQLNRQGVTRETLKAGDHVIISGNPGRNAADHRLRMRSISRPSDGWKWSGTFE